MTRRRRAKYAPLVCQTSEFLLICVLDVVLTRLSNIHHIKEIEDAGLELPAVNQLEVSYAVRARVDGVLTELLG